MALKPPLSLDDIEVSHRVGKIESQTSQADGGTVLVAKPHPIIVKFVSRRTKARVIAARKELRKLNPENQTPDCTQADADNIDDDRVDDDGDTDGEQSEENRRKWPLAHRFPKAVYKSDDLTRTWAKLGYQARMLKRQKLISDTWIFDCAILVKDNNGHTKKISCNGDLMKYSPR